MSAMTLERRGFLSGALAATGTALGLSHGRALAAKPAPAAPTAAAAARSAADLSSWRAVRDQFLLTRERVNLALMLLTSHPRAVRDAIDRHRRGFDEDPVTYFHENVERCERALPEAAASYLGGRARGGRDHRQHDDRPCDAVRRACRWPPARRS